MTYLCIFFIIIENSDEIVDYTTKSEDKENIIKVSAANTNKNKKKEDISLYKNNLFPCNIHI